MTVLWFAAKPARCCCSITRTCGKRSRTAGAEPSSDALSSTTISALTGASDSRHASRSPRLLVLTIETPRSNERALTREAARHERLTRRIDRVSPLLSLEPFEQLLHPGLERNLCAEPEQLVREARVRVAVTDIAGAVLVHDLGLELLAEPARDRVCQLGDRLRPTRADVERPAVGTVLLQSEHAAAGNVAHLDEVPRLITVLEDQRRTVVEQP